MGLGKNRSLGLLTVGVGLTLAGLLRGEAATVLEKGIRLCLQCMGLD